MADATPFRFTNTTVPKAYDEIDVPRLFEPWAKVLLDHVALRPSEAVQSTRARASGRAAVAPRFQQV